jgi:2-polyprenyl-6-methoxyphenol hydroxylase-like FAD-dependent oxidoreductase
MALEDALVLADLLAHQRVWSEVGRAFEQHRSSRIKHVRAATDQMFRLLRPPIWLRDLSAPVLGPRSYAKRLRAAPRPPLVRHRWPTVNASDAGTA